MPHFGLQLPSFTYPGVPDARLFDRVAAIAGAAEDAGFDSFWVMDHYHQIPNIGPPSEPMLEAYTVLSGGGGADVTDLARRAGDGRDLSQPGLPG